MVLLAIVVAACSDDDSHEHGDEEDEVVGVATQATCPTGSTLTYENFGKPFFTTYCLSCHSNTVKGDARNGAPSDHNFDTLEDVQNMRGHIDQKAGSGPAATNTDMPRSDPRPSLEERQKLSTWLACGAP